MGSAGLTSVFLGGSLQLTSTIHRRITLLTSVFLHPLGSPEIIWPSKARMIPDSNPLNPLLFRISAEVPPVLGYPESARTDVSTVRASGLLDLSIVTGWL